MKAQIITRFIHSWIKLNNTSTRPSKEKLMLDDKKQNTEDEIIRLAVILLFKHMREGKVSVSPHLIEKLTPAMDAVRFDDEGNPMLETVQPIVLSLVKTTACIESERLIKEEEERNPIHGMLPTRIDIPPAALSEITKAGGLELDKLAFDLYKETAGVLIVCASSIVSYEDLSEVRFNRNQAICIGLLVRIVKFMKATLAISRMAMSWAK